METPHFAPGAQEAYRTGIPPVTPVGAEFAAPLPVEATPVMSEADPSRFARLTASVGNIAHRGFDMTRNGYTAAALKVGEITGVIPVDNAANSVPTAPTPAASNRKGRWEALLQPQVVVGAMAIGTLAVKTFMSARHGVETGGNGSNSYKLVAEATPTPTYNGENAAQAAETIKSLGLHVAEGAVAVVGTYKTVRRGWRMHQARRPDRTSDFEIHSRAIDARQAHDDRQASEYIDPVTSKVFYRGRRTGAPVVNRSADGTKITGRPGWVAGAERIISSATYDPQIPVPGVRPRRIPWRQAFQETKSAPKHKRNYAAQHAGPRRWYHRGPERWQGRWRP